ncbi:hypothetical protein LTR78_004077 [Recurvomyces mirabilis]|uniref:Uncharacterized protein n=1 Tax=Recurvomyces mirabilis TaxID=574656 RepID=A0AAE0WQ79_9PEZI|nr:hypothetical protein LTR78_004077 [Recurvomyces mirabilis]KAK5153751.1 hypothetical protein LTS14_007445 [Recurvomyces mirabilis]
MPTFLDLPKAVRKRIYRLHLLQDDPITGSDHRRLSYGGTGHYWYQSVFPALLHVNDDIEEEAGPIYFSENVFASTNASSVYQLLLLIAPQYQKLIRKFVITWDQNSTGAGYDFKNLRKLKCLGELTIRVDEKAMVQKLLRSRRLHQRFAWEGGDPTAQQCLAILQFPGIAALLRLGPYPKVDFIERNKFGDSADRGGPIPGGVLETQVAPKLMGQAVLSAPSESIPEESYFPFFSLSPELRNRIYELLLCFEGQVQPSVRQPLSQPKNKRAKKYFAPPESALRLLEVNRQIYNEAFGIFYHSNAFNFEWTTHLHQFLTTIGPGRQKCLRDLTIHYIDVKSGGIGLVDITYPLLKQLTGLRKLTIIMHGDLAHKVKKRHYQSKYGTIYSANPARIPGIKVLFELRGILEIKVLDTILEEKVEVLEKHARYPEFEEGTLDECHLKVSKALKHLNDALAAAQGGNVCMELLKDDQWQMDDEFPRIDG